MLSSRRSSTRVLLVSTYELGHQPLGLAAAAAALRGRGHDVRCLDLSVEPPSTERFDDVDLIAISVPMHTAARLGVELARALRRIKPDVHIAFYGLYASPLYEHLTASGLADSVVGGEYELGLCNLADHLAQSQPSPCPSSAGVGPAPWLGKQSYPTPDRSGLPSLESYARAFDGQALRLVGYVEASRGCAHRCRHCPITPVYGGRLRLVQPEAVLADIDQLLELGARHITFGDPDFFNAVRHSMGIAAELHRRRPDVTFDATIKVEHLIEHEERLAALRDLGCLFITSAFESCNDAINQHLGKGHTRQDLERALDLASEHELVVRPTWVAFTPWGTLSDFIDVLRFIEDHALVDHVQSVQYALRLLLPPGSPLIELLRTQGLLGGFDGAGLTYRWTHRDPRVDALQAEVAAIVERSLGGHSEGAISNARTFARIKAAALAAATGRVQPPEASWAPTRPVPGLTEAWFC